MILSIVAQKGGTGKTTTAHALGTGLALRGKKVLLVDLDQQGSLSFICKAKASADDNTLIDLFTKTATIEETIQKVHEIDGLYIIPSNKSLAVAHSVIEGTGREYKLKEILEPVTNDYDFIIIDCPPSLDDLTINALTVSNKIIIPSQADILSISGIMRLYDSYQLVKKYTNSSIEVEGILLTRHNQRALIKRDLEELIRGELTEQLNTKVFNTTIREGVAIAESQYMQQSIFNYAKNSNVAKDYQAFIEEVLKDNED